MIFKEVTRVQSNKKRVLCLVLAFFMMFSCIEIFQDNTTYNMKHCNVVNRYSALVTLYDPITTNAEICSLEMLGTRNSARFVRLEKRSSSSTYIKESQVFLSIHEIEGCNTNVYSFVNSDAPQVSFGDTVIVDYIHNQDGEK